MCQKQEDVDPTEKDYGYIEYTLKTIMSVPDSIHKDFLMSIVKHHESERDYFTKSLRQVNHLVQIGGKPNYELMEPKWELYKVSISFEGIRKFQI